MRLRNLDHFAPAPWYWLFVSASLIAVANVAMVRSAESIFGEELGAAAIFATVGMIFGQLGLAALWAAWGPLTWLRNYLLAVSSLGCGFAISAIGENLLRNDQSRNIVLLETGTMGIVFPILLVILHLVRRLGRWRLLRLGVVADQRPLQVSLRGIFVLTTATAALIALARWWHVEFDVPDALREWKEFAQIAGFAAMYFAPMLIAPVFVFFVTVHRRRWVLHLVLAVALGYLLPLLVLLALGNFDSRNVGDFRFLFFLVLPLQLGAIAAASLGWGMLYAAGMRIMQMPRTSLATQSSPVGS